MAEYTSNAIQVVNSNQNVLFTETAVSCNKGYIVHREGAGIVTLRGAVNNPNSSFARYKISFGANIGIPTGGAVSAISVAVAINGEAVPTSSSIVTPTATNTYNSIFDAIYVTVPKGCCYTVSVENISSQAINVQNANLIVERTA